MKVVLQRHGETLRPRLKTLPVLLMNYQWSRERKWNWVRVSIVSTRTFRRTLRYLLEDENNEAFLQKTEFLKIEANISSWSYDLEGHAKKCVERY